MKHGIREVETLPGGSVPLLICERPHQINFGKNMNRQSNVCHMIPNNFWVIRLKFWKSCWCSDANAGLGFIFVHRPQQRIPLRHQTSNRFLHRFFPPKTKTHLTTTA